MMLMLQGVAYAYPGGDILFKDIDITINSRDKVALVGNNGSGKSTLLKIMAGIISPSAGMVQTKAQPYYVPQLAGGYDEYTIAQALHVDKQLLALQQILAGNVTEGHMDALGDDWTIEERCAEALAYWGLPMQDLHRPMHTLSGGQKTKVLLAGIMIHQPDIVLLDEPSNHLDAQSRQLLYDMVATWQKAMVVVSHDKTLLNLLHTVYEPERNSIKVYGGNYELYREQKAIEWQALEEELKDKEKMLRKAKETERKAMERQQKLDARGRKKQEKAGMPTIVMHTMRNNAEKSTARMKEVHTGKISGIAGEVQKMRAAMPDKDKMKIGFDASGMHRGKVLVTATGINYGPMQLWQQPLSFVITSGERISIKGANGCGKTTLVKMILGKLKPQQGSIDMAAFNSIYIDQDYSILAPNLTVYEQAQQYNDGVMEEHEVKSRLTHFLFGKDDWDKTCNVLSGGEKMKLILCCLTLSRTKPDMIVLDEPTNNLDMQSVEILTYALSDYAGTLIIISHDEYFLQETGTGRVIELN